MEEKKSMAEREKLITSEHIAQAADEIISPDYKAGKKYNNMNGKPKIFVYWKGKYIGARNLRREACKYANNGYYPSTEEMNGRGGEDELTKFFDKYEEFKVINLEKENLKEQQIQDYEWQREIQNGEEGQDIIYSPKGSYRRDRNIAGSALQKANYECEYDKEHESFISRKTNKPYMEAHHLIPMEFQRQFIDSIDIEENIICLCSRCHNEIHYGVDPEKIIKKLFKQRKEALVKVGIDITIDTLLEMYGLIDGN